MYHKPVKKAYLRGLSEEWILANEIAIDEINGIYGDEWIDVKNSLFSQKFINVFAMMLCRRLGKVFSMKDARSAAYDLCQELRFAVSAEWMLRSAAYADNGFGYKIIPELNMGLDHLTIQ